MFKVLPKFVTVEGADCVGKSAFAFKLINYLNSATTKYIEENPAAVVSYFYGHLGPLNASVVGSISKFNKDTYRAGFYDPKEWIHSSAALVQDRFFLSDYVYGKLFGDDLNKQYELKDIKRNNFVGGLVPVKFIPMSCYEMLHLFQLYNNNQVLHVVILADDAIISSRYVKAREMYSLDQVLQANKLYEASLPNIAEVASNLIVLRIKIDVTGGEYYEVDPISTYAGSANLSGTLAYKELFDAIAVYQKLQEKVEE